MPYNVYVCRPLQHTAAETAANKDLFDKKKTVVFTPFSLQTNQSRHGASYGGASVRG
jgi:hypothetical protein